MIRENARAASGPKKNRGRMENTCRYLALVAPSYVPFLGEQIRSSSLSLSRLLFSSLSFSFLFLLRSLVLLFSLRLWLSTLSNGCVSPFCIRDTYHLRVRRPQNRSVSRNNTRCHGHPSTSAHTNVMGALKRSEAVNVRVGNLTITFFHGICQIRDPTKSGTDKELISFFFSDLTTNRKQFAPFLLNLVHRFISFSTIGQ